MLFFPFAHLTLLIGTLSTLIILLGGFDANLNRFRICRNHRCHDGKHKEKLVNERARIEGDIGSIKGQRYGFNRPAARSEKMMIACGHRAMLGYNLNKLIRMHALRAGLPITG